MWWSPARLTRWWLPRVFRGADENCNPSVAVIVPPLGAFVVFWRRDRCERRRVRSAPRT